MKPIFALLVVFNFALIGKCDVSYFEVKLKDSIVFNSNTSIEKSIRLERSKLSELDLMQITYYESGLSTKNDYELQIQSPNKENEVLFVEDKPQFTFHMSWLMQRQFIGKLISISLLHKKYDQTTSKENLIKIFDVIIF